MKPIRLFTLSTRIFILVACCSSIFAYGQATGRLPASETQVHSPDGKLVVTFYQKEQSPGKKRMYYQVAYQSQPIVLESGLGVQVDNHLMEQAMALKVDTHADWCENLVVKNKIVTQKDTLWKPVYGERSQIRDQYNQAEIQLEKDDHPNYKMSLIIRVYNEGMAFRYFFPEHPQGLYYRIKVENSEFTFPESTQAYFTSWAQGPYHLLPLHNWPDESERPLTLRLKNGWYACLAEAQLTDYSRTKFKLHPSKANTIVTAMFDPADLISPVGTPWRVVMVAEKPGDLIEHNDLLLNLNPPNSLANPSWIQPGKLIREMTLTNEGAKACVDFAAAHHLQYILFDWKWYGPAFSFNSDATKVAVDLDLPAIIQYGQTKSVGVWLYVNQQALLAQQEEIFPIYKKWGIKGVKFGFVEVGSHRWTTWLTQAVKRAAENQLMVNIHDEYRPTGTSRTYPNVLTQEGIRGNEEMPDATHNTVLPFTRMIAGAGDYTVCYYSDRIKTTHAHQLALPVIFYSPLQTLFWYDKPSAYGGEPEIEFFEKVPTVWDETKVVQGEIGQFVTIARRNGEDWFVGTITNNEGRTLKLPLSFLPKGKKYIASLYSDDPTVKTATHVKVDRRRVDTSKILEIHLLPSGGQAIWLTPAK